MQKLRMDLSEIRVARLETLPGDAESGTVLGNAILTKTADCGSCIIDSCVTGSQRPCPYCP